MAKTILVTGGSRSGKSDYAQAIAETATGLRYYLATCPPPPPGNDPEMAARILAHQQKRWGRDWQTVEEPLHLATVLRTIPTRATVLLDCLTLWISNLLLADQTGTLGDEQITALADEVLAAARPREGQLIMVSGEVGCGLVSENALARRYQDLVGRCNQVMAAGATQVIQVVCGIPVIIKG